MKLSDSILLLTCAFVLSCGSRPKELVIGDKYLIAYNVLVDSYGDNYDVWTVNPETLERRNLTGHRDVAWVYAASSSKILFLSDRDTTARYFRLFQMDIDGGNVRKVSDLHLRNSWMGTRKNGEEIIVRPYPSFDSAFYIISSEGEILQKIYPELKSFSDPSFSPDGKKIVFRGGTKASKREVGYEEAIYIMNSDGSDMHSITTYPKDDSTAAKFAYKAGPPHWHPINDLISFQSFQNGKYSLYGVNSDGSKQWKLTDNVLGEGSHSWSPDGKWLAIEVFDDKQTQFNIQIMNWETKETKMVTDDTFKYQQAPLFVEK